MINYTERLTLLMQDIGMAQTAQRFLHCELLLTGGQLELGATAMTGPDAEASVTRRSIDLCFLEASGLDQRARGTPPILACASTEAREEVGVGEARSLVVEVVA